MAKPAENPTLAIGYIRASTGDQRLTLQAQQAALEAHCERHGLTLVETHTDAGFSGGLPFDQRPGLLAAIGAVSRRGAGRLLVAKRDRLARDVAVACAIEAQIEKSGASVESADGTGNGRSPEDELMRNLIRSFAQYERRIISARTKAALAAKKARGERVSYHHALGHTPGERAAIERMRELRGDGLSLRAICRQLAEDGHQPRGKSWQPQTVRRALGEA